MPTRRPVLTDQEKAEARKAASRAYQAKWRKENPEKAKEAQKEANRRWRQRNPEKAAAIKKRYLEKNKDKVQAWKERNKDKLREAARGYQKQRIQNFKDTIEQQQITIRRLESEIQQLKERLADVRHITGYHQ